MTERRIRVAHLVQGLEIGGLEKMCADLVLGLDPARFEPEVICFDSLGPLASRLAERGIASTLLARRSGVDISFVMRLASRLRRSRVDVLHMHNATAFEYGMAAAILARTRGRVFTEHDRLFPDPSRAARLHGFLARRASFAVAVSEKLRGALREFERFPAERLVAIHNGVDPKPFLEAPPRAAARSALGLPADAFVATIAAGLKPVKNHAGLLRAFARAARPGGGATPKMRLVLLGGGPLRAELESLARELGVADSVAFLGFRLDVAPVLAASDALVLFSESEGLPLCVLEGMAAGLPIVSSDVGALREVIAEGESGLLVAKGDEAALASALSRLASDAPLRERLGGAGRRTLLARFSLASMVERYAALYERAAGRGAN